MNSYLRVLFLSSCMLCSGEILAQSSSSDTQSAVNPDLPPLKPEAVGRSESLPSEYPSHWIIVHDGAFMHMLDGRMIILDPLAETQPTQFKGMFNNSLMGYFAKASSRPEMYVSERFYPRGVRGPRTDVITIRDTTSLEAIDEIVYPEPKTFIGAHGGHGLILIDDEKLLLSFNMTPATSVTVVDIVGRKILNEVAIPGCSLIYPTGKRGFSSLCSNGGILSTQLDDSGQIVTQQRIDPFFDSDTSPVYEKPAIIDGTSYFASYDAYIYPVDLSGAVAMPGERWSLLTEDEREANWRPSGFNLMDKDNAGNFYIIMHPNAHDGSQQHGGTEVWVYDPETKSRVRRVQLKTPGAALFVTKDENSLLLVANAESNIDVYSTNNGEYIRTLANFGQETPMSIFGAN